MSESANALQVEGFRFAGIACGIKKDGELDLGLIVADASVSCAGVFTKNQIVAAPVTMSRRHLEGGRAQAIVVNSGNANCATGDQGMTDAKRMATITAKRLGADRADVQVCSTGVIGQDLPMDAIEAGIAMAYEALTEDGIGAFAEAIMTTDTRPKVRGASAEIAGTTIRVAGVAKGAGMIHPDMATMLTFVVTDAALPPELLTPLWQRVCDRTFNAITIDGDTSTNDTALVMASGASGCGRLSDDDIEKVAALIEGVARELALDIVRDAEGGTKTVAITVTGAADTAQAKTCANTIALSPLVKTAIHGEDPNWGRVIAAAGRSGVALRPEAIVLSFEGVTLYQEGRWQGEEAEATVHAIMQRDEYSLSLDLGVGEATHTVYTCDLSAGYVSINADYRS